MSALFRLAPAAGRFATCRPAALSAVSGALRPASSSFAAVNRRVLPASMSMAMSRRWDSTTTSQKVGESDFDKAGDSSPVPPGGGRWASKHWKAERSLTVAMIAALPAAPLVGTQVADMVLAVTVPVHAYWGCKEIITDYVHNAYMKMSLLIGMKFVSFVSVLGLIKFNYYDLGIINGVGALWQAL